MHDITYVKGLIAGIPIGINGRDGADVRIILRTLGHFSMTLSGNSVNSSVWPHLRRLQK
jgi:hypothetical protein